MSVEKLPLNESLRQSDVLLIGGSGYLGSAIAHELEKSVVYYASQPEELDITDKKAVDQILMLFRGEVVILLAAITDVSGIEKDDHLYEKALRVNIEGAQNVAEACARAGKRLVFLATGYERAGSKDDPGPYTEDAPLADETGELELLGRYAGTKLRGDRAVRAAFDNDPARGLAVVFIDYPCGSVEGVAPEYQRDWYLQTLLRNQKKGYPAFVDQMLTITPVNELAKAIRIIARNRLTGVFHIAASGIASPYELLRYLIERLGEDPESVKKGSILEYQKLIKVKGGKLTWPIWGGLNCAETEKKLRAVEPEFYLPSWREFIDQNFQELKKFWQSLE